MSCWTLRETLENAENGLISQLGVVVLLLTTPWLRNQKNLRQQSIPQARVAKNAHLRHEPSLGVITHYLISELLQKECKKWRILTEKAKKDKNRGHVKYPSDHLQNCTFLMFGCQLGITWVEYKTVSNKFKVFSQEKENPTKSLKLRKKIFFRLFFFCRGCLTASATSYTLSNFPGSDLNLANVTYFLLFLTNSFAHL